MNPASKKDPKQITLRLMLVFFVAASVGLSMAWVSIGKAVLFIGGLSVMLWHFFGQNPSSTTPRWKIPVYSGRAIGVALAAFGLSLVWTTAGSAESLGSINKYGKLLTLLLLPLLLRSRREVIQALVVFVLFQALLATSSWLLYFGVPVPWATSKRAEIGRASCRERV